MLLMVQKLFLSECFPDAICTIRRDVLTWDGWLQPSAISHRYKIRITYKLGDVPEIILLEPDAQQLADKVISGRRPPHIYGTDPLRLCVHHPGRRDWKSTQPIATTIIPWTIMWLSFFEDWVCTDVWSGGGEHP